MRAAALEGFGTLRRGSCQTRAGSVVADQVAVVVGICDFGTRTERRWRRVMRLLAAEAAASGARAARRRGGLRLLAWRPGLRRRSKSTQARGSRQWRRQGPLC